jgi:hypothetical protein
MIVDNEDAGHAFALQNMVGEDDNMIASQSQFAALLSQLAIGTSPCPQ